MVQRVYVTSKGYRDMLKEKRQETLPRVLIELSLSNGEIVGNFQKIFLINYIFQISVMSNTLLYWKWNILNSFCSFPLLGIHHEEIIKN